MKFAAYVLLLSCMVLAVLAYAPRRSEHPPVPQPRVLPPLADNPPPPGGSWSNPRVARAAPAKPRVLPPLADNPPPPGGSWSNPRVARAAKCSASKPPTAPKGCKLETGKDANGCPTWNIGCNGKK